MARNVTTLNCVSPACPPHRGRHTPTCLDTDTKCDGCLPRQATDGLRLCALCTRLLAEDAQTLAQRDPDLLAALTNSGGAGGEHVSHSGRDPNLKLNTAAVDARTAIRTQLTTLVRLIVQERGVHLPTRLAILNRPDGFIGPMPQLRYIDRRLTVLAAFVARHALWLAGHPAAAEHAATLRALARSTWGVAFPSGMRMFPVRVPGVRGVALCPATVRARVAFAVTRAGKASEVFGQVPCSGQLWTIIRPGDDRLPAAVLCNQDDAHRWPSSTWLRRLAPLLLEQARREQAEAAAHAAAVTELAAAV